MPNISQSVGAGGANVAADVSLVQKLLGLAVTGTLDAATGQAIANFQRRALNTTNPDGRIDPGGKTWQALAAQAGGAGSDVQLSYAPDLTPDKQIVSDHAKAVIRKALAMAGMRAGVMTSTLRTPQRQAELMYQNAAIDLAKQYTLYAATGQLVLDVFKANRSGAKDTVIGLMRAKIESLLKADQFVSRHVVTPEYYQTKLNVVDLGVNSNTPFLPGGNVAALSRAFQQLETSGEIKNFIDETAKSNHCWHVEIVPA